MAVLVARPEPPPPELLAGRATALRSPSPPLTPQQLPGRAVVASSEPPRAELLAGRFATAPWGLVQPVQRPTLALVARTEERAPEAGRVAVAEPPTDHRMAARTVVARGEGAAPEAGRALVGKVGPGVPRAPGRVLVAAAEVRAPAPGSVLTGKPPPPSLTPQQLRGAVVVASAENALPFAGWCFLRQKPLVPSGRIPTRSLVARREEPLPFAGSAVAWRVRLGQPPPGRFVFTVARREEPPPAAGSVAKSGPAAAPVTPSQMSGRVVVARVESPYPDWIARGQSLVWTGYRAGAVPPASAGYRAGGAVRRADVQSRAARRVPRMNGITLAYQTKTKTPSEALVLVFDYSNWPEIVGGLTVTSAVVTGPGGTPLTGLTAGTPAVLAAAATVDSQGNTVAAGKGVQVTLFGGGAGDDVVVECGATFSSGDSPRSIQCVVAVRSARAGA